MFSSGAHRCGQGAGPTCGARSARSGNSCQAAVGMQIMDNGSAHRHNYQEKRSLTAVPLLNGHRNNRRRRERGRKADLEFDSDSGIVLPRSLLDTIPAIAQFAESEVRTAEGRRRTSTFPDLRPVSRTSGCPRTCCSDSRALANPSGGGSCTCEGQPQEPPVRTRLSALDLAKGWES